MGEFGYFTAILGNSGSGKTSCFLMPEIKTVIKNNHSFVLTDAKHEAFQYIGKDLKKNNYNIIVLNFGDENKSDSWNPLWLPYQYFLKGNLTQCYRLLLSIAGAIFNQGKNVDSDPFWDISSRDLFVGLALLLFEDATSEKQINLMSIYNMAMSINEKIGTSDYLKMYVERKNNKLSYVSSCMYGTINAPSDTKSSIMSVFFQKMRSLILNGSYNSFLCNNTFDLEDCLNEKTAFILEYENGITESSFISKIFIQQIITLLMDIKNTENRNHSLFHIFFEDFLLLKYYPDIEEILLTAKEKKISLYFCINNIYLLEKIYGENVANAIIDNCEKLIFTSWENRKSLDYLQFCNGIEKVFNINDIKTEKAILIFNHQEVNVIKKNSLLKENIDFQDFTNVHSREEYEVFSIKQIVDSEMKEKLSDAKNKVTTVDDLIKKIDEKIKDLENENNSTEDKI